MVAMKPIDFRKGHDGLAALVSLVLRRYPFTGTVFVFGPRREDRLKLGVLQNFRQGWRM
ncbi:IS66 family insertion sequence element accessory protein TnpB [Ochrobactrum sp. AP1BH01-1]